MKLELHGISLFQKEYIHILYILADGTQLTPDGVRVLLCFGAGAYLLLIDPFQFAAAQSAARAAGLCK